MPIMDIVKRSDFPVLGADAPQDYPEDILKRHVVADGDEAPRANPTSLLSQREIVRVAKKDARFSAVG